MQGPTGQALATQTEQLALEFNSVLASAYGAFQIPIANVQDAFQTTNFSPVPPLGLPVNVVAICNLTWMCGPPPIGPNIHANTAGYAVIAATVAQVIGPTLH